jgi:hypothetical protein
MKKSTLALAVAVGVLAQHAYADGQADAKGFLEGATSTLGLRNYYINTDNRDRDAAKAGQSLNSEWGQGFDLRFNSGYTQGRRFRPGCNRPDRYQTGQRWWLQRRNPNQRWWYGIPD